MAKHPQKNEDSLVPPPVAPPAGALVLNLPAFLTHLSLAQGDKDEMNPIVGISRKKKELENENICQISSLEPTSGLRPTTCAILSQQSQRHFPSLSLSYFYSCFLFFLSLTLNPATRSGENHSL